MAEPEYAVLYHSARTSKQANVEQMLALLRMAGAAPAARGGASEVVQQARASARQRVSETATLKAFRASEGRLETAPEAASASERAYTDPLFDFRSVRRDW